MALSAEKYIRVTTFKKDGTEVSTPTWVVALDDGKLGFYTSSTSGKAKRLKNNPKVVVQPSDGRGRAKPDTFPLNGTAVVVAGPERDAIYDKVVAKYGFMTKVTRFLAKVGGFVKRKHAAVRRPWRGGHALRVMLHPQPVRHYVVPDTGPGPDERGEARGGSIRTSAAPAPGLP